MMIDQDEWTNSLSLGSNPGQSCSGYEYPDTNPDYEPELSLDTGHEIWTWTKESRHESRAESRRLRTRITSSKITYWRRISSWTISSSSTSTRELNQISLLSLTWRVTEGRPNFFKPFFQVREQVMKFL